jgi:hypothetical protein
MFDIIGAAEAGGLLGSAIDLSTSHAYTVLIGDLGRFLRFTVGSTADAIVSLPSGVGVDSILVLRKSDSGTKRIIIRLGSVDIAWLNEPQVTVVLRWNGSTWLELEPPRSRAPYFSGLRYRTGRYAITTGITVTPTTLLYLVPWFCERDVKASAVGCHIASAASAGGICKMAVWANAANAMQPVGVPLAGSNTDITTTTNNQDREVTLSPNFTFLRGTIYWFGFAFDVAAPMPSLININNTSDLDCQFGRATMSNTSPCGYSTPYTYSSNIMSADLTSAVLTVLVSAGAPVPQILVA